MHDDRIDPFIPSNVDLNATLDTLLRMLPEPSAADSKCGTSPDSRRSNTDYEMIDDLHSPARKHEYW